VPGTSGVWVKRIGGEELIQLTNGGADSCPVWSPDGRSVAFSRVSGQQRTIYEVPASGGAARALYTSNLIPGHVELDWSPDGETVAFAAKGRQGLPQSFFCRWEAALLASSRRHRRSMKTGDRRFRRMEIALSLCAREASWSCRLRAEEIQRLTQEPVRVLGSPAWAPEGQWIIFAAGVETAPACGEFRRPAARPHRFGRQGTRFGIRLSQNAGSGSQSNC